MKEKIKNKIMENKIQKCNECGEPLKPSQYLKLQRDGESAIRANENLACRNYPIFKKAEKEIQTKKSEN